MCRVKKRKGVTSNDIVLMTCFHLDRSSYPMRCQVSRFVGPNTGRPGQAVVDYVRRPEASSLEMSRRPAECQMCSRSCGEVTATAARTAAIDTETKSERNFARISVRPVARPHPYPIPRIVHADTA